MVFEKLGFNEPGTRDVKEEVNTEEFTTLYESIERARQAWRDAIGMFDEATEKDNIDALIHKINACEREYIHLLKLARREGISVIPDIK